MSIPSSLGVLFALVSAYFVVCTAVGLGAGYAIERALPQRRIWDLPLDEGQLGHELRGNIVFLGVAVLSFTLAIDGGWVRLGDDGLLRAAATFFAMNFAFQAFYYGLHRLMHTRPLVRIHRYHHLSRVTTPLSGQSMSAIEALGWMLGYVGLPVLLSQVAPFSLVGWLAYIAYNVFGNIVGHANCEVVAPHPQLRVQSLFSGTFLFHALHHARWEGHYGFASAWADRLFGTEWDDWMELHARVSAAEPMTDLRERA